MYPNVFVDVTVERSGGSQEKRKGVRIPITELKIYAEDSEWVQKLLNATQHCLKFEELYTMFQWNQSREYFIIEYSI